MLSRPPSQSPSQSPKVEDADVVYYHHLFSLFSKHTVLTTDDREYGINVMVNFYRLNKNSSRGLNYLLFNKQSLALSYKKQMFVAIKNRNIDSICNLLSQSRILSYPELYDNSHLDITIKHNLISSFEKEELRLNAIFSRINYVNGAIDCISPLICNLPSQNATDCLTNIKSCVIEVPEFTYAVDRPIDKLLPYTFCFDTLELLEAVAKEDKINPETGTPFSPFALQNIETRFPVELAMVYYSLAINSA